MIKRTINYTDFDGNQREEVAYFNMTRTELMAYSFDLPSDLTEELKDPDKVNIEEVGARLLEKMGNSGVFEFVKDLVFRAYGIKSEDGRRFIKSEQLSTEFTQTLAYDEFIIDLFSGDGMKASEFINGLIPADMANKIAPNAIKAIK